MSDGLHRVELRELPVDIHRRAREHGLTMQRELALIHAADEMGDAPSQLLWLARQLDQRYSSFTAEPRTDADRSRTRARGRADLVFRVPADMADAAEQLSAVLEEVDEHCRRGDLVTLVTPPELVAYRRWFFGEFVRQIRDAASPTPWVAPADIGEQAPATPQDPASAAHATVVVDEDLDLEGAARVRPVIVDAVERGVRVLTVDLAACGFIDSVGISLLLTTHQRLRDAGGAVVVREAAGAARRALEVAGVYELLTGGS
jgi:anti-anti-sigma factor